MMKRKESTPIVGVNEKNWQQPKIAKINHPSPIKLIEG